MYVWMTRPFVLQRCSQVLEGFNLYIVPWADSQEEYAADLDVGGVDVQADVRVAFSSNLIKK